MPKKSSKLSSVLLLGKDRSPFDLNQIMVIVNTSFTW